MHRIVGAVAAVTALAGIAGGAPPVAAQEGSGNRTVITATRSETARFDTGRSVYVIDGEAMERDQTRDVPEALATLPGVHDQRTNRGAASPILRGLVGPQNLLLIDGVRFSTSIFRTGPNQYAALLDPSALRAVEVMLGPGSVLYGTDAVGGTINHLTLEPPDEDGLAGEVGGRFASADLTLGGDGLMAYRSDLVGGWVRAGYRHHDTLRLGGGDDVPASDFGQIDWGTKWRLALGDDARLTALYLGTSLVDAGRVDNLPRGDVRYYDNLDHFAYLRFEHRFRGAFLRERSATAHFHRLSEEARRFRCETEDGALTDLAGCISGATATRRSTHADDVTVLGLSVVGHGALLDDRLRVSFGAEGRHEMIGSSRLDDAEARGNFSDGSTYSELGLFLRAELRPYIDAGVFELVVEGGLRGTAVFASAAGVPGLGDVDYEHQGLVGGGGVRALFANHVNLYTSLWQGFRAPNLQETTVLGDTGQTFEIPNDALGPERAMSLEVGVKLEYARVQAALAAYRTWLDDAIVGAPGTYQGQSEVDGKEVRRSVNATETQFDGLELAMAAQPGAGTSLWLRASYIDGEIHDGGETTVPRRLPPFQGTLGAGWGRASWKHLFLGAEVTFAARQDELAPGDESDLRICTDPSAPHQVRTPCDGTQGWLAVRLLASVRPIEDLRVHVVLANALDQRYRTHGSGYDAPGLDLRVGARYAF